MVGCGLPRPVRFIAPLAGDIGAFQRIGLVSIELVSSFVEKLFILSFFFRPVVKSNVVHGCQRVE